MLSIVRHDGQKNIRKCSTNILNRLQSQCLSTCPMHDGIESSTAPHPHLEHVPSLPFVGSTIQRYSGTPPMSGNNFNYWLGLRRKFGDFYTVGLPGFGNGLHGTAHILTDPYEMAKVIRSEGKYPSGVVQKNWVLEKIMKKADNPLNRGGKASRNALILPGFYL